MLKNKIDEVSHLIHVTMNKINQDKISKMKQNVDASIHVTVSTYSIL